MIQMSVVNQKEANLALASHFLHSAALSGCDIAVLPEMFVCPYDMQYFKVYAEKAGETTWSMLSALAKKHHIYIVGGSIPELSEDGNLYNTCFVFDRNGAEILCYRKMHLFDIHIPNKQIFLESSVFSPGQSPGICSTEFGKIGVAICFDLRFPNLFASLAAEKVKTVFLPASFNKTTGPAHWELLHRARAVDFRMFLVGVATANTKEASYQSYGHSIAVTPWGDVLRQLDEKEELATISLDLSLVDKMNQQIPLIKSPYLP